MRKCITLVPNKVNNMLQLCQNFGVFEASFIAELEILLHNI